MIETLEVRQDELAPAGISAPQLRPRPAIRGWWLSIGSFALVTVLCAWMGFYTMFNSFGGWDDEGTLLSALKAFAHHGGLYTHVYALFGPFYFEALSTLFSWLPLSLDAGRVTTLVLTLLTSLGFGVALQMFTRSVLAGIATQAGTFMLLILSFADESMHPSVVVSLLFAVALIALALVARGQRSTGFVLLGAVVAALVLTIVNVGAFAVLAMLYTGLALAPPARGMRLLRAAAAVLFVGTPLLLMLVGGDHYPWQIKFLLTVAIAAAAVVVVTLDRDLQGLIHGRDAYRFLLGGGVMSAVVVVIALATGTRPLDLIRGVFIVPAHTAGAFTIAFVQPDWTVAWGVACLVGAVLYRRHRNRNSPAGPLDAWARVAVGFLIVGIVLQLDRFGVSSTVSWTAALPLLFLAAIPPVGATDSERIARVGVVTLAVLEFLVAYPQAGIDHTHWSSLLLVPVGILCLHDGLHQLRPGSASVRRLGRFIPQVTLAGLLASVVVVVGLGLLASVWHADLSVERKSYWADKPLSLPGSELIHLPYWQATSLNSLSNAIREQCSTLLIQPEMNSFYFWTGESPPGDWSNAWFSTGDASLQAQIAHRIEAQDQSRFCVLDNPYWWSFLAQGHLVPQMPLTRLVESFKSQNDPPEVFYGYELFVPQNSSSTHNSSLNGPERRPQHGLRAE